MVLVTTYGAAEAGASPRRSPNLMLAFALIAAALVACVGIITFAKSTNALAPVETFQMTKLGSEYMVASALMKHATDMAFDENAPVPENLAGLAKAAEDEMKIDAEVMAERR
mmetsp:Transcript_7179/g.11445  ORF Transcript_7179/g.11445 Transcript_7179/m.11445 type:complete len:112 (+) Transcript_7179:35-370(+)